MTNNTKVDAILDRLHHAFDYMGVIDQEDAQATAREIESELRAVLPQWQPIETAPAEGTFLVYMPEERPNKRIQVMVKHPNVSTIGNLFAFDMTKPTHWMPLPERTPR